MGSLEDQRGDKETKRQVRKRENSSLREELDHCCEACLWKEEQKKERKENTHMCGAKIA
jgi:hypothetical protein